MTEEWKVLPLESSYSPAGDSPRDRLIGFCLSASSGANVPGQMHPAHGIVWCPRFGALTGEFVSV